ncbi:wax ester/triacylglycerol synthase domain-containing protein [Streptomyces lancefieldiae]|uniref:diacylglycerol O-acyltransferase n=1 Tax=Streptomyces lancefieldiae TaxID=3075520 RepID=A0ABU3AG44_9ACTN|nr:wax ester/triacylglycerol synthase domain-containing protein [Streptomyces sp. DSM 40712]MDT0609146.1 wax ester/triacylglycerol synthase family O-acyltransferase [Streptomyces sp. DSM 40712]
MSADVRTHPIDRAYLRLERAHPDARWDTGGIAYLSGRPPRLEDFRAYVGMHLPKLPMLTHRLERTARPPVWRPDETFTLERHVHEVVSAGPDAAQSPLETALGAPLPRDAPWGLWLVHGRAPDEYAVCYRFEHVCQDGIAAALAFRTLLGTGEPARRPLPAPRGRGERLRRTVMALGLGTKFAFDVLPVPGRRPAVPFVPSGRRRLLRARVPLERLRRIGTAHGVSANDVHLAALAGALGRWSGEAGVPLRRASALMPVDARRHDEEQTWGNRTFAVPVQLPLSEDSPSRRLVLVAAATSGVKRSPRRQAIHDLVRFMPARPTAWYMRRITSPDVTAMVTTSVPLAEGGALGSTDVTGAALLPLLLPGHLCGVGLAFFGEWAEVSFMVDHALPLGERLPDLWTDSVAELERGLAPTD